MNDGPPSAGRAHFVFPPEGRGVSYCSTRGARRDVTFEDVVMSGMAPDKGLYVPQEVPKIPPEQLEKLRDASFIDLALFLMRLFIGPDDIPPENLKVLLQASTKNFRVHEVTPVRRVGPTWVLELFHGPTFAFKDVALQFLGNLFEYFLTKKKGDDARLTVLGATSGDTGSAAIHGLRGKKNVEVFILYPKGRVSEVQEKQMTTVMDKNVHCISIAGNFDDAQSIVKQCFGDKAFRERVGLGAVNSINWARVLAQITYYFYAYFQVCKKDKILKKIVFSVPTGNFGDVLAGYYAKKMGLPVERLIVATNVNDIVHRFFTTGKYWKKDVQATLSPSMDISISSNFERLLFDLADQDSTQLCTWMEEFERTEKLNLPPGPLAKAREDFLSARVTEEETVAAIQGFREEHNYTLCPHSAIGIAAAKHLGLLNDNTICLATAHHAKFINSMRFLSEANQDIPTQIRELEGLPTKSLDMPAKAWCIKNHIDSVLAGTGGEQAKAVRWWDISQGMWGNDRSRWIVVLAGLLGASALMGYQLLDRRRGGGGLRWGS